MYEAIPVARETIHAQGKSEDTADDVGVVVSVLPSAVVLPVVVGGVLVVLDDVVVMVELLVVTGATVAGDDVAVAGV